MVIVPSCLLFVELLLVPSAFARVLEVPREGTTKIGDKLFTQFSQASQRHVSKRALTFDQAVTKGCQKLNWLQGSQSIDQSVFTDASALSDNGWVVAQEEVFPSDLTIAFQALGYSTADADNVEIEAVQEYAGVTKQAYGGSAAGTAYDETDGTYTNVFNKKNGVIVATYNYSPQYQRPDTTAPPLNKYSDVTWLLWESLVGDQTVTLNYFFRHSITEEDSVPVIEQVLAMSTPPTTKANLGDWPGLLYRMDTDLGKALLGIPNGAGTAFFLGQHQNQLGRLTIHSANVLIAEGNLNIAFKIGPVDVSGV